jgi:2-dehydro-3-deoxyphosphogluconate aldolase/(4S)-4-hydroxy-2-oxoglutarate aldolase
MSGNATRPGQNDTVVGKRRMMDKAAVWNRLQEVGLVPVLRAESVDKAMALASAIAAGGVEVVEVTMTVP